MNMSNKDQIEAVYGSLFSIPEMSVYNIVSLVAQGAMVLGGVVPYIPQYLDIRKSQNAEGFSTYVCLALLVANTLRILFWFGKFYELPLLVQSIIMVLCMMMMLHLCVNVKNRTEIVSFKKRTFLEMKFERDFWQWTDFLSYIQFMTVFSALGVFVTYMLIEFPLYVETIGFLAVFTEAMLGVPQFWQNLQNRSTQGMSIKMVCFWLSGDIFKTVYFLVRKAPLQFFLCGALQVSVDLAILCQVGVYWGQPIYQKVNVL